MERISSKVEPDVVAETMANLSNKTILMIQSFKAGEVCQKHGKPVMQKMLERLNYKIESYEEKVVKREKELKAD